MKAISALHRVLKRYETITSMWMGFNPDECVTRGAAYSRLRRFDEADKDYEEAMKWAKLAPELHAHYAGYLSYRSALPDQSREELATRALDHLEKAQNARETSPLLFYDSDFRAIRDDPRFKKMLEIEMARMAEDKA